MLFLVLIDLEHRRRIDFKKRIKSCYFVSVSDAALTALRSSCTSLKLQSIWVHVMGHETWESHKGFESECTLTTQHLDTTSLVALSRKKKSFYSGHELIQWMAAWILAALVLHSHLWYPQVVAHNITEPALIIDEDWAPPEPHVLSISVHHATAIQSLSSHTIVYATCRSSWRTSRFFLWIRFLSLFYNIIDLSLTSPTIFTNFVNLHFISNSWETSIPTNSFV